MSDDAPYGLTPREEQIVRTLAAGYAPQEVAQHLHIESVKNQMGWAREKMEVPHTLAMVAKWWREQEVPRVVAVVREMAYMEGLVDGTRIRRAEVIQSLRAELDERQAARRGLS